MLDAVVIGAGVVGCSIAHELAKWRLKTAVYERDDDVGAGTSKANSAIVHSGHSAAPGSEMARLNVIGNAMYPELCRELDVPFKRNGSLTVAFSQEELTALDKVMADGLANGVPNMRMLGHDELHRMEPNLGVEAIAALFAPTGGIVCPYELTVALAENAARNGVRFHRATPVTTVRKIYGGWAVVLSDGTEILTRAVINAAGVYSDVFNNMVSAHKLKIQPRKGEYWMVDKSYANAFRSTIFVVPGPMGKGVLVSPTVDGTVIVGPTAEDIDDKEDVSTTNEGLANILKVARRTWPGMPASSYITTFAGIRAHLASHDFVLGEPEDAPLFFNAAGIESPGLTAAPAIGTELASAVAARLGTELNQDYRPGRPAVVRFRHLDNAARAKLVAKNPEYGRIVCRCETVTEAEVRDCIRRPVGARTVDGVKRRTRAGMGRCQGGFCLPRVVDILADELGLSPLAITKCGRNSFILTDRLHETPREEI